MVYRYRVNTVKSGTLKVDIVGTDANSIQDGTLSLRNKNGSTDILWESGHNVTESNGKYIVTSND